MTPVELDGRGLTPAEVETVGRGAPTRLAPAARSRMEASVPLAHRPILREKWSLLVGGPCPDGSDALVRTFVEGHCAGVGPPLPVEQVRAMMVCRANVLATGHTGCRPEVAELLLAMLDADIVPVVPRTGAVGVGGSIPLAHIVQVMARFGGHAHTPRGVLPAAEAMAGLPGLTLTEKEALSLINGSTMTAALGALAVVQARRLLDAAVAACALSFEVMRADTDCLDEAPLAARNHPGAIRVARRLRRLLHGSSLATPSRNPDPFSVRCAPHSLGATDDALRSVEQVITRELNGATDNPLVFPALGRELEGGNFHGAPVAVALDHLKAAVTQLGAMSERRLFRMTYGRLSGLPSFLVKETGTNSGLMLAQYTAASLVSACKGLAHPASVDSIPTIQHHEDHVSMGPLAATGALEIVELLSDVVAIELLCAAQGLDFHLDAGERPAPATMAIYHRVREHVPTWVADRVLHHDLVQLGKAVRSGVFGALS